ncbi:hypothetical protein O181_035390 [Austropuccinia psidii MF-1]|uniref:Uncharacterized protein n=1 Tax=Austropuccinia psidii MF-1 TaxID=1389203 RepID=A0A9Q3D4N7_9BASI|nr:hypothetical protein [Austropuccinia psidii MF-1]
MPCKQTPRQPTPGPSGTQWLEELFCKPPIPGPSPSSKPPEDVPTCEAEPEVAPTQSTEEPFAWLLSLTIRPLDPPSPSPFFFPNSSTIPSTPSHCLQAPNRLFPPGAKLLAFLQ